jgi:hypothetical protein
MRCISSVEPPYRANAKYMTIIRMTVAMITTVKNLRFSSRSFVLRFLLDLLYFDIM